MYRPNSPSYKSSVVVMLILVLLITSSSLAEAADYPNQVMTVIQDLYCADGLCLNSDDSKLYVAYWLCPGSIIDVFDLSDYSRVSIPFGSCHGDVVASPDDRYLYTPNYYYDNISRIDLLDGNTEITLGVGSWPADIGITPDKSKILVKVGMEGPNYDWGGDQVTIVDVATFSVLAEVELNDEPLWHGTGFSPDNTKAYVIASPCQSPSTTMYEISLVTPYGILRTLQVGDILDMAGHVRSGIAATDSKVYVSDYLNNQILIIDQSSFSIVGSIPVGANPGTIAVTPDTKYLYAMSYTEQSISVIDLSTETIVETIININPYPSDIEFSKDGSRAYVGHRRNIDDPTSEMTGAITVLGIPSTLSFPSVAVAPCDSCEYVGLGPDSGYVVQPVVCNLNQEARAATIPVKIPEGIEICDVSFDGLPTGEWDGADFQIKPDSGFLYVYLLNYQGFTIPEGPSTLFNIQFRTERLCNESKFVQWDTALSAESSRRLEFTDLNGQGFAPLFDYDLDASEILGYMPGDLNESGDVTIGDVSTLIDHLFITGVRLCNYAAADVNGPLNCDVTISDVSVLIDYLFITGPTVELHCGCVSTSPPLAAKGNANVSILSSYEDGYTTITVSSAVMLRGLQLQVQGSGTTDPINLTDNRLDLFHGVTDDVIRIGMIDMNGLESISVGNTPVIRLEGEYEIISALVTDQNHQDIVPTINGARKNEALPMVYALAQNYPNPFNPATEISYSIKQAGDVRIDVFNMLGQKVATLFEGYSEAGHHAVNWDASDQASGVYLYRLTAGEFVDTKKMMLLK